MIQSKNKVGQDGCRGACETGAEYDYSTLIHKKDHRIYRARYHYEARLLLRVLNMRQQERKLFDLLIYCFTLQPTTRPAHTIHWRRASSLIKAHKDLYILFLIDGDAYHVSTTLSRSRQHYYLLLLSSRTLSPTKVSTMAEHVMLHESVDNRVRGESLSHQH